MKNAGAVSVMSLSLRLTVSSTDDVWYGICGVIEPVTCGVQVAGENVNLEDGVDTEEKSVEFCDESESSAGVLIPVGYWSPISPSVSLSCWVKSRVDHVPKGGI